MPVRFYRKESVANGFRRLLGEQTGLLVSLLADRGGPTAERIHQARVELKRMRALLRVAKSGLESETFTSENAALREAGRKLAQAREAQVSLAVFDALTCEQLGVDTATVRQLLEEEVGRKQRRSARPTQLAGLAATLRACGHALSAAPLEVDDWSLLEPALHASYRSARDLRKIVRDPKRESELHKSRKRVKRLFYQLEFLRRALPKSIRKVVSRLRKLGVLLGAHHDLCVLRATLAEHAAHGVGAAASPELARQLKLEAGKMVKDIRKLAKAAFAERPKSFLKSVHTGWKKWRAGEPVQEP